MNARSVALIALASCRVEVRVGSVPTEEPTPIGGPLVVEVDEGALPEYAIDTAETLFRERDFPGLRDELASELQGHSMERAVAAMAVITGPVVGHTDLHSVIAFETNLPSGRQALGDYIFETRWEEGEGFLRLEVGLEDGELRLFGAFVGIFESGQTIEGYTRFIRTQLGLPARAPSGA